MHAELKNEHSQHLYTCIAAPHTTRTGPGMRLGFERVGPPGLADRARAATCGAKQ